MKPTTNTTNTNMLTIKTLRKAYDSKISIH